MAPATTAAANRSSAPNKPASPKAVETCVPLISARPSLACNLMGCNPALRKPSAAGTLVPLTRTWPIPSSVALKCARGARSPEAPTDPCAGIIGIDLMLEQRQQGIDQPHRDAGMAARQRIDLERENQPHDGIGKRIAHAGRVRQQQIPLQQLELLVGDARLRQQSESRIDAVGRIAARDDLVHQGVAPMRCAPRSCGDRCSTVGCS